MTAIETFTFPTTGHRVRTVLVDGEPWFVAGDVGAVLALGNVYSSLSLLDDDERGLHTMETPSGDQAVSIVSEAGLYSLILRSRKQEAKAFKRWVTHEVLPAIRRTGSYAVAPRHEIPQTYAAALREAATQAERAELAEAKVVELEPKATSWDVLATAHGDYAVADAAKILTRDPAITVGRDRLFTILHEHGWTYRQAGDRRWRAYQTAIETGRLTELPGKHYHPRTGELVLDSPQVRVTVKGLHDLHRKLGGVAPLRTSEQLAIIPGGAA